MKTVNILSLLVLSLFLSSCFSDVDDNPTDQNKIKDFVYRGLNIVYLYKDDVPDLLENKNQKSNYNSYLDGFSTPEDLFYSLIYKRETVDKFSWITDDYIALESYFQGESLSNGLEFGLVKASETGNSIFGYVRYVLPNSPADQAGLKRGDIFTAINGTNLDTSNYRELLQLDSYTLTLADIDGDKNITPNGKEVSVAKVNYVENPIFITKTLDVQGKKIGYLMYNSFTGTNEFDTQLNAAFGQFKSDGVTDLVLDLRYNPGGAVRTATWLCSMITGQFTGDIILKQQWNSELQADFEKEMPERLVYRFEEEMIKKNADGEVIFSEKINHLNLKQVYVLTTEGSASASELIINGLNPYIDVVQIGDRTAGKYQASITLYDSKNFSKENVNPTHTYAMQPLVFKSVNSKGVTDYSEGLIPDFELKENIADLGVLGNENEPLLAKAIAQITGKTFFKSTAVPIIALPEVANSKSTLPFSDTMYINNTELFLNNVE